MLLSDTHVGLRAYALHLRYGEALLCSSVRFGSNAPDGRELFSPLRAKSESHAWIPLGAFRAQKPDKAVIAKHAAAAGLCRGARRLRTFKVVMVQPLD